MIPRILFCFSMVALGQFGLYYWRANMENTANRQISDRVKVAAGIPAAQVTSRDFRAILSIHELTPELKGSGSGYRTIRAYYSIVEEIGRLIPSLTGWAESEMTLCTRYAAVLVDQRLERNVRCAAQLRGI